MKTAKVFRKIPTRLRRKFLLSLDNSKAKKGDRLRELATHLESFCTINSENSFNSFVSTLPKGSNKSQIRKDLHEILNRLLFFLGKEELENKPYYRNNMILDAITLYNLEEIANSYLTKTLESLPIDNVLGSEYYLMRYRAKILQLDKTSNIFSNKKIKEKDKDGEFHETVNDLKIFYAIECIRFQLIYAMNFPIRGNGLNLALPTIDESDKNNQYFLFENTLKLINSEYPDINLAKITIKQLTHIIVLDKRDLSIIYESLQNVFVRQMNSGKKEFDRIYFDLINCGLFKEIHSNQIDIAMYRNYIFCATKVKEFVWALEFAKNFKDRLNDKDQETAYSFNKARIYINMKQYEDVITTLRDVEYKDITYNLNSKLMLIVSFYELNEYEPLLSTIRAFKVFLRRRRNVSVARKANFTGFCDALYNIMLAEENRDVKRIRKAKEIIDGNPAIPNTGWLKEKIEELKL